MIYLLTFILFLFQLADWYSTRTILAKGGYEQNPVMAFIFKHLGVDIGLGVKTILVTFLGFVAGNLLFPALVFIVLTYCFVLYHNWKSL